MGLSVKHLGDFMTFAWTTPEGISMELNRNPFRFGSGFDSDEIVGRRDEIIRVERAIRDGQRLFVIGPRGSGKTSILRAAQTKMSLKGAIVLYANAEASADVGRLIGEIVADAIVRVYGAEAGIHNAGRIFSHLEPKVGFSAAEQNLSVRIGINLYGSKYRGRTI